MMKKIVIVDGVLRQVEMSQGEIDREMAALQAKAKAERAAAMMRGAVYTLDGIEYRISFTKDDGDGLMQVKSAFELGLASTIIYFANGAKMPITAEEFEAFTVWFVNKRNEFFV